MSSGSSCLRPLAALSVLIGTGAAVAQLSPTSWWPKFQRDTRNMGDVPVLGFVTDAHVIWATRLSDPILNERHATPVFSPDNQRLYVGGPNSTLMAVTVADGALLWTVTLGDGTGQIHMTPAIGADGSVYVGAWDAQAPYDGFCKVRDDGAGATVVWTYPLRAALASPTITADGLIIVGGRHESTGWGYYALRDLGDTYEEVWSAAQLADPGDPASTGRVGASPALSPDGLWIYGGSDGDGSADLYHRFWQISAATGVEQAALPLTQYCWAAGPVVTEDGYVFLGEGTTYLDPDGASEGKLHVFAPGTDGTATQLTALPLQAGDLNGGSGALHRLPDGRQRLYVPANGFQKPSATLIAINFDAGSAGSGPTLTKMWTATLGPSAWAYPQAVVTRDDVVYVLGPANHTLYAFRDGDTAARSLWSMPLALITRVDGWLPGNQRGPQGVAIGPDQTIYWNAADGYLYAIRGWLTGDLDGDGAVNSADLNWMVTVFLDRAGYQQRFPEIDPAVPGDINGNGQLEFSDLTRLVDLLVGP